MKARPLFIGGTSSNAGKSWMVTAICAWLRGKGVSVAPFKAQNMSNNSYPCKAGGEIGRAQVAQAEACGLEPEPSMNPILSTCFGVFPHTADLHLDAEDSLALQTRPSTPPPPGARLAVIHFPHVSNATDFRLLTWADWITSPRAGRYDFIILPGSKNTMADLSWLRDTGLADWILQQHRAGTTIIGICGGYQVHGAFEHPDVCADVFGIDVPSATSKAVHYERLAAWFAQHARHLDELGLD